VVTNLQVYQPRSPIQQAIQERKKKQSRLPLGFLGYLNHTQICLRTVFPHVFCTLVNKKHEAVVFTDVSVSGTIEYQILQQDLKGSFIYC
jgi:hypothetical protein